MAIRDVDVHAMTTGKVASHLEMSVIGDSTTMPNSSSITSSSSSSWRRLRSRDDGAWTRRDDDGDGVGMITTTRMDAIDDVDDGSTPRFDDDDARRGGGITSTAKTTTTTTTETTDTFAATTLGSSWAHRDPTRGEPSPSSSTSTSYSYDDGKSSSSSNVKRGGGGLFSAISKTTSIAHTLDYGNSKKVGNILLSELFPYLYSSSNAMSSEEEEGGGGHSNNRKRRNVDPTMMYDRDHFESYEQAMNAVFEEAGTIKAISKFVAKDDITNGEILRIVKEWLLSDHRIVDPEAVRAFWKNVEGTWADEKWMTGISTTATTTSDAGVASSVGVGSFGKSGGGGGGRGDVAAHDSKFESELRAQRMIFLARLIPPSSIPLDGVGVVGRHDDDDDDHAPDSAKGRYPGLDPVFVVADGLVVDPLRFYDITQHLVGSLARYCARRARSSPMVVAWSKIKECGIFLPKDTVTTLLYVCGTMGMADSIGMSGGIGAYSSSSSYDGDGGGEGKIVGGGDERFLVPEEVATYHDLSSKPTEASISLRIKSLASKGDARSAETLLEAFKVSPMVAR